MKVKIVSWNCKTGFTDDKQAIIKNYDADILIIPECRELDMEGYGCDEKHRDWYGDHLEATMGDEVNKQKDLGIGLFWKDNILVNRLPEWDKTLSKDSDFRYLVPYIVYGKFEPFTLIAVWTKDKYIADKNDRLDYDRKAHAAIDHYKNIGLLNGRVILIGDFNTFAKDDEERIKFENEMKPLTNCADKKSQGKNTYHHAGNNTDGIDDFCFASQSMIETKPEYFVHEDWKDERGEKLWPGFSDHCPISVVFELES